MKGSEAAKEDEEKSRRIAVIVFSFSMEFALYQKWGVLSHSIVF